MAIAEEDGLIVDLMIGGMDASDAASEADGRRIDARRLDAVSRLLKLIDASPAIDPPSGLAEATLRRIEAQ